MMLRLLIDVKSEKVMQSNTYGEKESNDTGEKVMTPRQRAFHEFLRIHECWIHDKNS